MLILIILLVLIAIGAIITKTSYDYDWIGAFMFTVFGFCLVLHCLFWALASYNYNVLVTKRNAFVETLDYARKSNNPVESAAVLKDISEWNQDLAEAKYNATVFLLKDYVDKRVLTLQPIK